MGWGGVGCSVPCCRFVSRWPVSVQSWLAGIYSDGGWNPHLYASMRVHLPRPQFAFQEPGGPAAIRAFMQARRFK